MPFTKQSIYFNKIGKSELHLIVGFNICPLVTKQLFNKVDSVIFTTENIVIFKGWQKYQSLYFRSGDVNKYQVTT